MQIEASHLDSSKHFLDLLSSTDASLQKAIMRLKFLHPSYLQSHLFSLPPEKIIEKKAFVQGKAGNLKISPMVQKSIKGSCKEKIEEIMKNKENVKTLNKISFQKVQKCSECQKDLKNEEKSMVVTLSCMHKVHKVRENNGFFR